MNQKFEQREIFKEKFKELCNKREVNSKDVLANLRLHKNYVTLLGLVRIANYFEVSISALLEN
ncbi:MAG: hypothetical protein BWY30_01100 [Tenericutes bacterium ADurb.Bin239]|nr:MAG: hypothetical protein BWY30_01100 [Tenericutes bacterium ADurb.Bin239]